MLSAILALAAQSTFTVTNATYAGPVRRPAGARMVWSDEFNGRTLDLRKWRYETAFNKKGWFNKELQYYSAGWPGNLRLDRGRLIIEARRETPSTARGLGRAALRLGPDHLEGARLDLWFLRSARQAALRARHLAGDLDASGRHEEMARRRRDRHHGAGRVGAAPHLRLAPHRPVQPCAEDAAQRAAAGPDQLPGRSTAISSTGGRTRSSSASTTSVFFAFATTSRAGRGPGRSSRRST